MRIALIVVVASARLAHADQCEWLDDKPVTDRAMLELELAKRFVTLCEPCGDKAPSAPQTVTAVTSHRVGDDKFDEILVNGASIDLAYTYVDAGDHYQNLAQLAGCPATGVSPSVTIDGEPNGAPPSTTSTLVPVRPTIDHDALTRWEVSLGDSFGTVRMFDVSGLTLTAGMRTHRLAVFADYRHLTIRRDPGAAVLEDSSQPASQGTLQRFGIGARYNVITLGARDHDAPAHDLLELFGEADVGAERIASDGTLWRRDAALGVGARLGFRVSDTRTIGVVARVLDIYGGGLLTSLSLVVGD